MWFKLGNCRLQKHHASVKICKLINNPHKRGGWSSGSGTFLKFASELLGRFFLRVGAVRGGLTPGQDFMQIAMPLT